MYEFSSCLFLFTFVTIVQCQTDVGDECVDQYTGTNGVCALLQNCKSAKEASEGNGIPPTFCTYKAFNPTLVCCLDDSSILNRATSERAPIWNSADSTKRVSERKCEEYSKNVVRRVGYVPLQRPGENVITSAKCDYLGTELIVGGEKATLGEFPHMVALGWSSPDGYTFPCGGSLISPRFIVTAGHCISYRNATPVIIRLGDQNIDPTVNDGADPIDVPIRNILKHPEYKPPKVYNDIALMEMATDVKFRAAIRPACLWTDDGFAGHTMALATGWGVINDVTKQTSKELLKVSLSLLQNSHCNPLLRNYQSKRKWTGFSSSQICAGELRGGKDTCQGDSGSPLQVVSADNQCIFYVMGVVSFGRYCAVKDHPGVYTRVSSYIDWIEKTVWPGE